MKTKPRCLPPGKTPTVLAWAALLVGCLGTLQPAGGAENFDAWKNRLPVTVDAEGLTEIAVPPLVLDAARANLADLRLIGPEGTEVAFLRVKPAPGQIVEVPAEKFRPVLAGGVTTIELAVAAGRPVKAVTLKSPTPRFLVAVRVEGRQEGGSWEVLAEGAPIFRQPGSRGAEQLGVSFPPVKTRRLRITVESRNGNPAAAFNSAALRYAAEDAAKPVPIQGEILQRIELAGKTRLEIDFGAAHLDLATFGIATGEPLFTRRISLLAPSIEGAEAREKTIASGTIFRVAVDGAGSRARLETPARLTTPARRLILVIENGDSPPLTIQGVTASRHQTRLRFLARQAGAHALLVGNPLAESPRYDLAALGSALRGAAVNRAGSGTMPAELAMNPAYAAPGMPAGISTVGAAIDTGPWAWRKLIEIAGAGIQELELDAETLARSGLRGADWRIVAAGEPAVQVPYLVERPAFSRTIRPQVSAVPRPDPKRPSVGAWALTLPVAGLPATAIVCRTEAPLFERSVTLIEEIKDSYGQTSRHQLGRARWVRTPRKNGDSAGSATLALSLTTAPKTARWILEMDNGDNAPIVLTDFEARYPVVRLLFKTEPAAAENEDSLSLYFGNPKATPPRYDLALTGPRLLRAERTPAILGTGEILAAAGGPRRIAGKAGILFWTVLILVVAALIFLVARLLPKPDDEAAPPPL